MAKLVAYYSRTDENYFGGTIKSITVGNTEKVAKIIAELVGADLFEIRQKIPYDADYSTCTAQARADLESGARPEIESLPENFEQYDEFWLGCPNYWGTMPMAVYTFLESLDFSDKVIHPFCTHEGSGLSSIERDIARTAKGAEVTKGLAVRGSDADRCKAAVEKWVK